MRFLPFYEKNNLLNQTITLGVKEWLKKLLEDLTVTLNKHYRRHGSTYLITDDFITLACSDFRFLAGYCWQSTEIASLFLPNDSKIIRSTLWANGIVDEHAYISFRFEEIEYVFDPAPNLIGQKDLYDRLFLPNVKGETTAFRC